MKSYFALNQIIFQSVMISAAELISSLSSNQKLGWDVAVEWAQFLKRRLEKSQDPTGLSECSQLDILAMLRSEKCSSFIRDQYRTMLSALMTSFPDADTGRSGHELVLDPKQFGSDSPLISICISACSFILKHLKECGRLLDGMRSEVMQGLSMGQGSVARHQLLDEVSAVLFYTEHVYKVLNTKRKDLDNAIHNSIYPTFRGNLNETAEKILEFGASRILSDFASQSEERKLLIRNLEMLKCLADTAADYLRSQSDRNDRSTNIARQKAIGQSRNGLERSELADLSSTIRDKSTLIDSSVVEFMKIGCEKITIRQVCDLIKVKSRTLTSLKGGNMCNSSSITWAKTNLEHIVQFVQVCIDSVAEHCREAAVTRSFPSGSSSSPPQDGDIPADLGMASALESQRPDAGVFIAVRCTMQQNLVNLVLSSPSKKRRVVYGTENAGSTQAEVAPDAGVADGISSDESLEREISKRFDDMRSARKQRTVRSLADCLRAALAECDQALLSAGPGDAGAAAAVGPASAGLAHRPGLARETLTERGDRPSTAVKRPTAAAPRRVAASSAGSLGWRL